MDYKIENIYQGSYSSLDPNKGYSNSFTGYRINTGDLGMTTHPEQINVIKEVSSKLAGGLKQIELTMINPKIFDAVPQQQLKEINQLSKLTGIGVSVHGPVMGVSISGISQQGFDEMTRQQSERVIINTLERSHEVDPKGNVNVTFHTSEGLPGSEWKTLGDVSGKKPREFKKMIVVDKDTGRMVNMLDEETLYYPSERRELKPEIKKALRQGLIKEEDLEKKKSEELYNKVSLEKGRIQTPEDRLNTMNNSQWDDSINQLFFNKERADQILEQNSVQIQHLWEDIQKKDFDPNLITPTQRQAYNHLINAKTYLDDVQLHVEGLFNKAYKYGTNEDKKILSNISEEFQKDLKKDKTPLGQSRAVQNLIFGLKNKVHPQLFEPLEDFALEKTSQTFGNAAFAAYKKFKDKAPIISIENPPVGHALSTGEDLKNVVQKSREEFVKKAKQEGIGEGEAKKIAEKLIGATWDVGHINMLRKQGFGKEEIVKESEKIRPFLKHVHLSDNFGMEHTELPMGMGNVPMKEIMEKLGKEGFEAKKIIEAGDWWTRMQTNPTAETLEGLGSPIYANGKTPYWNQALGFYQGYQSGLEGAWLPGNNYQTFGTYFSQLPTELGGQAPAAQGSRMSGRGME